MILFVWLWDRWGEAMKINPLLSCFIVVPGFQGGCLTISGNICAFTCKCKVFKHISVSVSFLILDIYLNFLFRIFTYTSIFLFSFRFLYLPCKQIIYFYIFATLGFSESLSGVLIWNTGWKLKQTLYLV